MKWQTLALLPVILVGMVWMFYLGQEKGKKQAWSECLIANPIKLEGVEPDYAFGVDTGIYAEGPCEMGVVVRGEKVLTVELRPCQGTDQTPLLPFKEEK